MNDKILRIAQLCLGINQNTERPAFFEFSGHVSSLHVSVRESKKEYQNFIYESDRIYVDNWFNEHVLASKLNKVIENLEGFLNEEVKEVI